MARRGGVRARLAIMLSLPTTLLIVGLLGMSLWRRLDQLEAGLADRSRAVLEAIEPELERLYEERDDATRNAVVARLGKFEAIHRLMLVDDNDSKLLAYARDVEDRQLDHLRFEHELRVGADAYPIRARMLMHRDAMHLAARSGLTEILLTAAALLLACLGLGLGLGRRISAPLLKLSRFFRDLDVEELPERRVDINDGTEIGDLAEATNELLDRIQAHEDFLEQARSQAERLSLTRSSFLAQMSSELRMPLTSILGYSESLANDDVDDETTKSWARVIQRNGEQLLSVMDAILDFAKLESEHMMPDFCSFAPRELIESVAAVFEPLARERGLDFGLAIDRELPTRVESDPIRLRQALLNLLSNAIKFTEEGFVRISARVQGAPDRPELVVDIEDSGVGMSQEHVERAFRPFVQADPASGRRFGGTGLGLSISRGIAELLGGELTATSEPRKGSCFSMRVPVRIDAIEEARSLSEIEGTLRQRVGRILLAEDMADNRLLIAHVLRKAGHEVIAVEHGRAAIDALQEDPAIDLVLMDMQMPVLDGYAAARELRRQGWPGPIIAVTVHGTALEAQRCKSAGCDDHIAKPLRRKALLGLITRYLKPVAARETQALG